LGVLSAPGKSTSYRDLPEDECIGGYPALSQIADLGVDAMSLDAEGRCVVIEFPAFVLLGVYSPANSSGQRDDYRYAFLSALDIRIRNLDKIGKRVILTGDLNASRDERDTAGAEEDKQKMGITHDEYISTPNRRIFNQLLEDGEVVGERDEGRDRPVMWDILRGFHPTRRQMYTHWQQKINARPGNYGSRIDHILCSIGMKDWFQEANIQEGLMGSDHCPVYAILKDDVELDGNKMNIFDMMNPPGVFKNGQRIRKITTKDHPPFSGKLLPEFDKRRSIKDMFKTKERLKARAPPQPPSSTASLQMAAEKLQSSKPEKGELKEPVQEPSTPKTTNKFRRDPVNENTPKAKRLKSSVSEAKNTSKDQRSLRTYFKSRTSTPSNTVRPKHRTEHVFLTSTDSFAR
jgi:AP endonuclease-2